LKPPREWLVQPGGLTDTLRALRKTAGLTGEQLSELLGWANASKLRQAENGHRILSDPELAAWAEKTGQPEAAQVLLDMAAAGRTIRRQYMYQHSFADVQRQLDGLFRSAKVICDFESFVVPGLLQTPEYARFWFETGSARSGGSGDVDEAVTARRRRQDILDEQGREFQFLIMESLLSMWPCPDEVMLAQFDRLTRAALLRNVSLGVVPFSARIVPPVVASFVRLDDATYLESLTAQTVLEDRVESERYGEVWAEMAAAAVTGQGAVDMITAAMQHHP
jgi:transcriptional regulator with XRE-family HTH domain